MDGVGGGKIVGWWRWFESSSSSSSSSSLSLLSIFFGNFRFFACTAEKKNSLDNVCHDVEDLIARSDQLKIGNHIFG